MAAHDYVRERDDLIGQRVEWQGQSWFVAVAQDDETHWHLTLTSPEPSRQPTPLRQRVGRSAGKERATTSGITWLPAEQVPGAVLSAESQRRLTEQCRAIDECQARARVTGASYVIYR